MNTENATTHNRPAALLSVYDKTHIIVLAEALLQHGYQLISSGGTFHTLQQAGLPAREVSEITHFPEMMGGRVKTLHPKIHGGILARRGTDDELLIEHDIPTIDVVVVNLYPFAETISQPGCTHAQAIEQIDIGGPTLIRGAAKNHSAVTVLTDPADYQAFIALLEATNEQHLVSFREQMALKAFQHTAYYDSIISHYLFTQNQNNSIFPAIFLPALKQEAILRYGENPHQAAALYRDAFPAHPSVVTAKQEQGKPLSYNNLADSDAGLDTVRYFTEPTCVIVKHANPCGVACADTIEHAYAKAWETDPTSAFGGIIALNRNVDATLANTIIAQQFVEVILAPSFSEAALAALSQKPNIRALSLGDWDPSVTGNTHEWQSKRVAGGLLVQTPDSSDEDSSTWKVVTEKQPSPERLRDLAFAWKVVRTVKSNAIVFARNAQTLGIGAGQMSRVFSTRIACEKAQDANLSLIDSVMASDAFFPFADGIEAAVSAGVSAIIQPGGSVRDEEVIAAANAAGIAMVFTGKRHFNH